MARVADKYAEVGYRRNDIECQAGHSYQDFFLVREKRVGFPGQDRNHASEQLQNHERGDRDVETLQGVLAI